MKRKKRNVSYSQKRARSGLWFCLPFLLGFLLFFLMPMLQSIRYSFSSLKIRESGLEMTFVGLQNFKEALFTDPQYVRTIVDSMKNMLIQVPIIILFSLFMAVILNQKFRGRMLARAVFFLPVIVVSGVIVEILSTDYLSSEIMSGAQSGGGLFRGMGSTDILISMGIPYQLVNALIPFVYDIFDLVWNSGVQILIFLAGLQTIPGQLYECASMEGCTAWETFWKITFPLVSPMILMNVVFTVIDYCTTSLNPVIKLVNEQTANMDFAYAAGLSWMYLIVVLIFVGIIYFVLNKRIIYLGG